jgi:predicted nucleic acid-binding protein
MSYLFDSSVWIEYFKGNQNFFFISNLIRSSSICTNDIILTELLPSILHKKENDLANLLNTVRKNRLLIDWTEIRNIQLLNLKHGNNNIGIPDIIIVQNCIQNDSIFITQDKHFALMAAYLPLQLFEKNT